MTQKARDKAKNETNGLRVLLVDDHDLFRTGLRNLLEEQTVQVVGEAADGAQAIRMVRELAPDVVVMDLNMPGISGVEATRQVTALAPLTRVVVLTISDQDDDVMDAIVAGACGYLVKDSSIEELMRGISAASVGESLISPPIAAKVLQRMRAVTLDQGAEPADPDAVPRDRLQEFERHVRRELERHRVRFVVELAALRQVGGGVVEARRRSLPSGRAGPGASAPADQAAGCVNEIHGHGHQRHLSGWSSKATPTSHTAATASQCLERVRMGASSWSRPLVRSSPSCLRRLLAGE
jgi:DNA-binding NarL/FixJ family response regulator